MPRVLLTCLLAATLLVGGCGSDQPEATQPVEPAAPAKPAEPARTATPQPSASHSPTPAAKPRDRGRHKVGVLGPNARPRRTPAAEHLLAPEDLPAIAGAWSVAAAQPGEGDPAVGLCQKTGLVTIGALEAAARTYSSDGATAVQVVARFGDSRSAWRAHEVLEAWREDCAERVGNATVGALEEVGVPTGVASSYRAELRKRAAGLGILRNGAYLTVVEITSGSYPGAWEPARVAVRRIARTF